MCVNRLLQGIIGNAIPFGGKVTVLGKDFPQVLLVVLHNLKTATVKDSIKFSPLWPVFKILKLTQNL